MYSIIPKKSLITHLCNSLKFFLEIWKVFSPFIESSFNWSIGIPYLEIVGDCLGSERIDLWLYSSYDDMFEYIEIETINMRHSYFFSSRSINPSVFFASQSIILQYTPLCRCILYFIHHSHGVTCISRSPKRFEISLLLSLQLFGITHLSPSICHIFHDMIFAIDCIDGIVGSFLNFFL